MKGPGGRGMEGLVRTGGKGPGWDGWQGRWAAQSSGASILILSPTKMCPRQKTVVKWSCFIETLPIDVNNSIITF